MWLCQNAIQERKQTDLYKSAIDLKGTRADLSYWRVEKGLNSRRFDRRIFAGSNPAAPAIFELKIRTFA